jgi:ATP-dependent RNA helicase RhlE
VTNSACLRAARRSSGPPEPRCARWVNSSGLEPVHRFSLPRWSTAERLIYASFVHLIYGTAPGEPLCPASLRVSFLTQFSELGLAEPVQRAISGAGYETPTPIQAKSIPSLLEGRDLVGIAQTGTGKTAAFVLPLLTRLAQTEERAGPRGCRALILAPTRELAAQIDDSIKTYSHFQHFRHTVVVGGVKPRPQIKRLEGGVDILVATPGRLLDHVGTGALRLDNVKTIILDEADQMMDLGFMPAIRQVMAKLRKNRQTILFSATMPPQIRKLASDFLDNPVEVSVTPQSTPIERIDQHVLLMPGNEKRDALRDILADKSVERAIVFTRTKRGADRVVQNLGKDGLKGVAIHGNKSQNQRERALAAFKDGNINILVATDIAARGIDVDGITHVVNYELPNVPEVYVHRIGRTARAGSDGIAVSLVEPDERCLLRDIEKTIGQYLTPEGAELHIPKPVKKPGSGGGGRRNQGGGQRRGQSQRSGKPGGAPKSQKPRRPGGRKPGQGQGQRRAG